MEQKAAVEREHGAVDHRAAAHPHVFVQEATRKFYKQVSIFQDQVTGLSADISACLLRYFGSWVVDLGEFEVWTLAPAWG